MRTPVVRIGIPRGLLHITGIVLLGCASTLAAEIQGADALLKALAEARARPSEETAPSPTRDLLRKLVAFRTMSPKLADAEAAAQWLAFLDTFLALSHAEQQHGGALDRISLDALLLALPAPSAWDPIAAGIEKRAGDSQELRDHGLRLFAQLLRDDPGHTHAAFLALRHAVTPHLPTNEQKRLRKPVAALGVALAAHSGEKATILDAFEDDLAIRAMEANAGRENPSFEIYEIPDLAALGGKGLAAACLRHVVVIGDKMEIAGEQTHRLAVEAAMADVGSLKRPPWSLIKSKEDMPLFELLQARSMREPGWDKTRGNAGSIAFVQYVVQGRNQDAARLALLGRKDLRPCGYLLSRSTREELLRQGQGQRMADFLQRLLSSDPSLPFWDDLIAFTSQMGQADATVKFMRELSARQDLPVAGKADMKQHLADACFPAGLTDEGLRVLREDIAAGPPAMIANAQQLKQDLQYAFHKNGIITTSDLDDALETIADTQASTMQFAPGDYLQRCFRLSRLGRLLAKSEIVEEGIAAAQTAIRAQDPANPGRRDDLSKLAEFLSEIGRAANAEEIYRSEIMSSAHEHPGTLANLFPPLLGVYHRAGHSLDALKLIDQSPYWFGDDLSGFELSDSLGIPVLFIAAKGLSAAGRPVEARRVLLRLLQEKRDYDPAFALLLEVGGGDTEAQLDALARRDRFEKRPLIWKAKLQLDAGRIAEAEQTARAAIAIDPSDGEAPKGDRMRAYAILGDILEKKGAIEEAVAMRKVVQAIRLAETADEWQGAGLPRQAIKMYEQALAIFPDAYCIQSRLALRYASLGEEAKADACFERAFELMPQSFGRVESHCFACEGIFDGAGAQSIAERVFKRIAAERPDNAQAAYLLGYLRQEQGRPGEAVEQFLRAVKIDPEYMSAWRWIGVLSARTPLPKPVVENTFLTQLRLDPGDYHRGGTWENFGHLRTLWGAALEAEKSAPPKERGSLYPLAAVQAIAAEDSQPRNKEEDDYLYEATLSMSPRNTFVQLPVWHALSGLFDELTGP